MAPQPIPPYAREAKRKPQAGGIIALHQSPTVDDRKLADTMMTSNCGTVAVKVLEEGEVDIGERTQGTAQKLKGEEGKSFLGIIPIKAEKPPETKTDSTMLRVKEWQIVYECQG
jgi:hypothetical protein